MSFTLWHNPRCSKSRETLALLIEKGIDPDIRLYQKLGPSTVEIREVRDLLGLTVIEFTRVGDALFKELGLTKASDDDTLIKALAANPSLIERPILISSTQAALGRPPENVLKIL